MWAQVPSWEWHRAGVGPERSRTIVGAARRAAALERTLDLPLDQVEAALRVLPGVGVWTAAEVRQRAHGDPDAVSVADFHVAGQVVYALTGELDGDDDRMLELLEPWAGHRYRVVRMIELSGVARPRRGPRYAPLDHRTRYRTARQRRSEVSKASRSQVIARSGSTAKSSTSDMPGAPGRYCRSVAPVYLAA